MILFSLGATALPALPARGDALSLAGGVSAPGSPAPEISPGLIDLIRASIGRACESADPKDTTLPAFCELVSRYLRGDPRVLSAIQDKLREIAASTCARDKNAGFCAPGQDLITALSKLCAKPDDSDPIITKKHCDSALMDVATAVAHQISALSWDYARQVCIKRCEDEKVTTGYVAVCDLAAYGSLDLEQKLINGLDTLYHKRVVAQAISPYEQDMLGDTQKPTVDPKMINNEKKDFKKASACDEKVWATQRQASSQASVGVDVVQSVENFLPALKLVDTQPIVDRHATASGGAPGPSPSPPAARLPVVEATAPREQPFPQKLESSAQTIQGSAGSSATPALPEDGVPLAPEKPRPPDFGFSLSVAQAQEASSVAERSDRKPAGLPMAAFGSQGGLAWLNPAEIAERRAHAREETPEEPRVAGAEGELSLFQRVSSRYAKIVVRDPQLSRAQILDSRSAAIRF